MIFQDREEAAELLLEKLQHYKGKNPLVLGIPRGAVPMADIIAKGLEGELNVILVHKISAPMHEEFAVASIGLSGHVEKMSYTNGLHIPDSYLEYEAKRQLKVLQNRQKQYGLSPTNYQDRLVIIIDDGIATGATTLAAVKEIRYHQPKKIILASPVSARDSYEMLKKEVDEIIVLELPVNFYAVGQFYHNFSQVSDEEVIEILNKQI